MELNSKRKLLTKICPYVIIYFHIIQYFTGGSTMYITNMKDICEYRRKLKENLMPFYFSK